mmetsp:Transcript_20312/g.54250  ORF Transcript_20312/g.54250 Transcript_20312/m.54250 type:complete len:290 (-) Transcript_20312:169-1038(-)
METSTTGEQSLPSVEDHPVGGADASTVHTVGTRCYCYVCEAEAPAENCADFELRCQRCSSTCVEVLDAAPSNVPAPPAAHQALVPEDLAELRVPRRSRRHLGVRCDGCHRRDFPGVRYRCLRCHDFDLCAACHARRSLLHPSHPFEAIQTPRTAAVSQLMGLPGILSQAASRAVVAIIEIGLEEPEAHPTLDEGKVAWWLAEDGRLADMDNIAKQDPAWVCPICSEGLEAEGENGWVVRICGTCESGTPDESAPQSSDGHVYHQGCLRQWLLRRNSCPVCRRTPVIPES